MTFQSFEHLIIIFPFILFNFALEFNVVFSFDSRAFKGGMDVLLVLSTKVCLSFCKLFDY